MIRKILLISDEKMMQSHQGVTVREKSSASDLQRVPFAKLSLLKCIVSRCHRLICITGSDSSHDGDAWLTILQNV